MAAEAQCVECKLKDRDIRDLEKDKEGLQHQVAQLNQQAQEHIRLGSLLEHGKGTGCSTCKQDLESHNEKVIEDAFKNISDQALRQLALDRGIIPRTIRVPQGSS